MNRVRCVALVAAALFAVGVLGGCGIGSQADATRIDPVDVPFGLLEAGPTTTQVDEGRQVTVYLVASDRLVAIARTVSEDATLADLVELVVAGPTPTERALGATTAVPAGTVASAAGTTGGTTDRGTTDRGLAEVDLTTAFGEVRSEDQLLAIGQIVYTLTEAPGIGAVQFSLDGQQIGIPAADGTQRDGPVTRDDVARVAPR